MSSLTKISFSLSSIEKTLVVTRIFAFVISPRMDPLGNSELMRSASADECLPNPWLMLRPCLFGDEVIFRPELVHERLGYQLLSVIIITIIIIIIIIIHAKIKVTLCYRTETYGFILK